MLLITKLEEGTVYYKFTTQMVCFKTCGINCSIDYWLYEKKLPTSGVDIANIFYKQLSSQSDELNIHLLLGYVMMFSNSSSSYLKSRDRLHELEVNFFDFVNVKRNVYSNLMVCYKNTSVVKILNL